MFVWACPACGTPNFVRTAVVQDPDSDSDSVTRFVPNVVVCEECYGAFGTKYRGKQTCDADSVMNMRSQVQAAIERSVEEEGEDESDDAGSFDLDLDP